MQAAPGLCLVENSPIIVIMKSQYKFSLLAMSWLLFLSCKDSKTNSPVVDETDNVWAEQVESSVMLTIPSDSSYAGWNEVFKKVDQKKIYSDIFDAVLSGKQKAYNFFTDSVLTLSELKAMMCKTDSTEAEDLETGKMFPTVIIDSLTYDKISLMRIREKVYFDKVNFKIIRKPSALILYKDCFSEDGTYKGYKPLFYVKLNN